GHGASVAHNPGSNMRLGNGLGDMRGMRAHGVNVGIGTDGANCSDNLNMYEAMRLASFASKAQGPDLERWVTTEEVALAATEGSARALGLEGKIGRLAPGYKADIVFLDLGHVNWLPLNDPTNQLVEEPRGSRQPLVTQALLADAPEKSAEAEVASTLEPGATSASTITPAPEFG